MIVAVAEYLYRDYKTSIDRRFELFQNTESVQVLFNGNSHTGCLGTPYINGKKSFNFSVGGQDIFHIYTVLKTALQNNNQIEKVIVGIDYDLFGYDYEIANTMWLDRNYYKSTGILYDSTFANRLMAQSGFFQANRDFGYLKKKFSSKDNANKATEKPNFVPIKGHAEDRAKEHSFQKYDINLIEMNKDYLEKLIQLVKSKGMEITLVNLPKKEAYYNFYNDNAKNKGKEILNELSTKHNILFIDFWRDSSFVDKDFLDGDHLTPEGAEKVLRRIEDKIKT